MFEKSLLAKGSSIPMNVRELKLTSAQEMVGSSSSIPMNVRELKLVCITR